MKLQVKRAYKIFFFEAPDKLSTMMKNVIRVNRRQYKTDDTMQWVMSKPREPIARYKNRFNH